MERFIKGDVVIVPFPFSDLSQAKKRPALIVADLQGDDIILCQITSQFVQDSYALQLSDIDFESGSLHQSSHIRPNRLFTAERTLILYRAGKLKPTKMQQVTDKIVEILRFVPTL